MSQTHLQDHANATAHNVRAVRPWLRGHGLANALFLLCVAVFAAQWVFQHISVCAMQVSIGESGVLALGVLLTGAVFNWVSMDLLLTEWLPLGGHLSVTLGILASVVLMASVIRAVSMAMHSSRWNVAGIGWLMGAFVLVCVYASTSALGFCVTSRTWLP